MNHSNPAVADNGAAVRASERLEHNPLTQRCITCVCFMLLHFASGRLRSFSV